MKKSLIALLFLLAFFVLGVMNLQLVSADIGDQVSIAITSTIDAALTFFQPIFNVLFDTSNDSNDFFFAKILLGVLLFVVINAVLRNSGPFKQQKSVVTIVSLIISILAIRFISDNDLTNGILLPYGTLGVVLTTILPFLIFFYFVHASNMSGGGRRISWIFFAIVFFVLWAYKYDQLGEVMNQIYGWTLIAMVIVFIFDKNIHYYFRTHEISIFYRKAHTRRIAGLQSEYLFLLNNPSREAEERKRDIQREIQSLGGDIKNL